MSDLTEIKERWTGIGQDDARAQAAEDVAWLVASLVGTQDLRETAERERDDLLAKVNELEADLFDLVMAGDLHRKEGDEARFEVSRLRALLAPPSDVEAERLRYLMLAAQEAVRIENGTRDEEHNAGIRAILAALRQRAGGGE